jgi:hypothetical protein
MQLLQAICIFVSIGAVLATQNVIGDPGNTTFTVSLVARGAPACITLTFNSLKACQSYFLTAHYQNCSYTPQVCHRFPADVCPADDLQRQDGRQLHDRRADGRRVAPGAGLCVPAAIGQASTFTVAAVQDVSGNAAGAITFEYASNAQCIQAAGIIQVLSGSEGPCAFTTMCRDGSGNPSKVLVISPMANAGATNNNFDLCQICGTPRRAVHVVHCRLGQRQLQLKKQ